MENDEGKRKKKIGNFGLVVGSRGAAAWRGKCRVLIKDCKEQQEKDSEKRSTIG